MDMSCNPWPIIVARQSILEIPCHIRGPENNDIADPEWYRRRTDGVIETVEINNRKYMNPAVSEGIGGGRYRQVNFTLRVINVSESMDIGCYWCMINVSRGNCSFSLLNSSQFCLLEESEYSTLDNCTSLPVNDTMVCGSNMVCDPLTGGPSLTTTISPQDGVPLATTIMTQDVASTGSPSLPIASTDEPSSPTPQDSPPSDQFSTTPNDTPTSGTVPRENTPSNKPTSNTVDSGTSTHTYSLPSSPLSIPLPTQTVIPESAQSSGSGLSAVQIGFYVGLGICVVLLVIILVLAGIVILLCRRKPHKEKESLNEGRHVCILGAGCRVLIG